MKMNVQDWRKYIRLSSKKELKNLHNLLAEKDKWKEVLEEFENNEF